MQFISYALLGSPSTAVASAISAVSAMTARCATTHITARTAHLHLIGLRRASGIGGNVDLVPLREAGKDLHIIVVDDSSCHLDRLEAVRDVAAAGFSGAGALLHIHSVSTHQRTRRNH